MLNQKSIIAGIIGLLMVAPFVSAQNVQLPAENEFDEQFDYWPVDLTIRGNIILGSGTGSSLDKQLATVAEIGAEMESSADSDDPLIVAIVFGSPGAVPEMSDMVALVQMDEDDALEQAVAAIESATYAVVCHEGELEDGQAAALHELAGALRDFVLREGSLVLEGAMAELAGCGPDGIQLVPDSLIVTNFDEESGKEDLLEQLEGMPRTVGIGIPADSAIELRGRKIRGEAVFLLPGNDHLPVREKTLVQATRENRNPYQTLVDLTAWRRDAIERTLEPFPRPERVRPYVANGTLIIVGGGGMPPGSDELFIELAGGEDARLVYVPCAEQETISSTPRLVRRWQAANVADATWVHTKDRNLANGDEEFLEPLRNATGLFFGGGRQWNLADSYYGTEAHRLMKEVLDRGGVVCGSSAGASIQGGYLARANPVANFDIMAPGYERGLGFLRGVAIDQHFSQRRRQKDLESLVVRYPQLLGIGIDEGTALVVRESEGRVIGAGKVWFYDQPEGQSEPCEPVALPAGSRYDLATRSVISQPDETDSESETDGR